MPIPTIIALVLASYFLLFFVFFGIEEIFANRRITVKIFIFVIRFDNIDQITIVIIHNIVIISEGVIDSVIIFNNDRG